MSEKIAVGIGYRTGGDPYQRGVEAARDALRQVGDNIPSFAFLLGGKQDEPMEILKGVREVLGQCPLVGCVSDPYPSPPDVIQLILIASSHVKAKVGVGRVPKGDWDKGISEAFRNSYIKGSSLFGSEGTQERSLQDWYLYRPPSLALAFMISRPSKSRAHEQRVVSFLGKKFHGRVPILMYSYSPKGGLPLIFADKKIVREGIVMVIIKTELQFGLERFHNFEPLGVKLFVTKTRGKKVVEFNGRPALKEYLASVSEKTGHDEKELSEMISRYPLAYRGRGGRYHIIIPEKAGKDMSITLPRDPEPDLPLYPMAFIQSREEEFYGTRMAKRDLMEDKNLVSALIIRNNELADQPPLAMPSPEEGKKISRIYEIRSGARLRAHFPEEYWEGEASHISLLLRKDMDPIAMAASDNAKLLSEVFRLKELNQKVFDGIGYGIAVLDEKLNIMHSNDTYGAMMGSPDEDLRGRRCPWIESARLSCSVCAASEAIKGGSFSSMELELEKKKGDDGTRWFRIDAFPLCDAEGKIESAIEVVRDVSEIKNLQISLEQEKRKMEAVVNGIAESLYIVDKDMNLQFFHRGALPLPQGADPDFLHKKCYEAIFKREFPCPWCRVTETFDSEKVIRRVANVRDERGNYNYFQITFSPWRDTEKRITAAICLLVDITAQHKMEKQLIKSEKLNSLAVLSAGMAHELNNPLGAINFNLEVLRKKEKDPVSTEILVSIKKDVVRINKIVGNLLSFSRSGSREYRPLSLQQVVDSALDLLRVIIKRGQVDVKKFYQAELPMIQGNFQDLQQVFVNLISNALDAMPSGGNIDITVVRVDFDKETDNPDPPGLSTEVKRHSMSGQGVVELLFSDTGIGINPEDRDRVFDPFFTTKPETRGTGLGLSVVHKILENHAATISVESEMGRGTTFIIRFPCLQDQAEEEVKKLGFRKGLL